MKVVWLLSVLGVVQLSLAQYPCPDPYPEPIPKLYKNYKLVQATINNVKKNNRLLEIVDALKIDVWKEPRGEKDTADLFVSPDYLFRLTSSLVSAGIRHIVTGYNFTDAILTERARIRKRTVRKEWFLPPVVTFDLNEFNTYTEIMWKLTDWVESCPNGMRCQLTNIGETHQGRAIKMITLGARPPSPTKKAIYLDCLTHAREWISGSTCLYIINKLITGWQVTPQVTALLLKYDFILVPVVNPDGYVYTWGPDRKWRKNRQPNPGATCANQFNSDVGTDINRNFDSKWCTIKTGNSGSESPCSDVYCGSAPGSSQEAAAIMKLMKSKELWWFLDGTLQAIPFAEERLLASVSIHSYAYMWLFPWGHRKNNGNCKKTNNYNKLNDVAAAAAQASENAEPDINDWTSGSVCEELYAAPGTTVDFVFRAGCKYSFSPELRGTDFIISPNQIGAAGNEAWQGIVTMISLID